MQQGEGLKKFIMVSGFTTFVSILLENGAHMPDDPKMIGVTFIVTSMMTYIWLFIRARFKFETDVISIIGSIIFMAPIGGILTGWMDNWINGEKSFAVDWVETLLSHKWHFLFIVIGAMLLSKKARKSLSGFVPDFEFQDD